MKGIVFNLLQESVRREHGEDAWDALLDGAGLDGVYTSLGSYPDADLGRLVSAASALLGTPPDEIVRWAGRTALPQMAECFPQFFAPHAGTRPFLLTLNNIIHPEVRKLYPGADAPDFVFDTSDADVLRVRYQSARRMCAFARGLIEGAAAFYGEHVSWHEARCMHRGDAACEFELRFCGHGE